MKRFYHWCWSWVIVYGINRGTRRCSWSCGRLNAIGQCVAVTAPLVPTAQLVNQRTNQQVQHSWCSEYATNDATHGFSSHITWLLKLSYVWCTLARNMLSNLQWYGNSFFVQCFSEYANPSCSETMFSQGLDTYFSSHSTITFSVGYIDFKCGKQTEPGKGQYKHDILPPEEAWVVCNVLCNRTALSYNTWFAEAHHVTAEAPNQILCISVSTSSNY